jgi:hypothetical protein
VLKRAGRRKITERTDAILAALRSPQLGQPPALTAAYAATVRSLVAVIATLNDQVASLQGQVEARFVRNDRLIDALMLQAFGALRVSPDARAFYDQQRARGCEHNEALRRLASRLVGILHGCLKTRTCYDEATAWGHREDIPQSEAAA